LSIALQQHSKKKERKKEKRKKEKKGMAGIEAQFHVAAEEAKKLTKKPNNSDLLALYALFKQSTEGDCNTSFVDLLLQLPFLKNKQTKFSLSLTTTNERREAWNDGHDWPRKVECVEQREGEEREGEKTLLYFFKKKSLTAHHRARRRSRQCRRTSTSWQSSRKSTASLCDPHNNSNNTTLPAHRPESEIGQTNNNNKQQTTTY
jgi:hypothetical protein